MAETAAPRNPQTLENRTIAEVEVGDVGAQPNPLDGRLSKARYTGALIEAALEAGNAGMLAKAMRRTEPIFQRGHHV